jgi:hypothetical protein
MPSSAITAIARTVLWGHHLAEQLAGPPVHGQFGLQLSDASFRCAEFGALGATQPGFQARVDAVCGR